MDKHVAKEYEMATDIWEFLSEVQKTIDMRAMIPTEIHAHSVPVGDFKIVLMAVFGIKGNKRIGILKPPPAAIEA